MAHTKSILPLSEQESLHPCRSANATFTVSILYCRSVYTRRFVIDTAERLFILLCTETLDTLLPGCTMWLWLRGLVWNEPIKLRLISANRFFRTSQFWINDSRRLFQWRLNNVNYIMWNCQHFCHKVKYCTITYIILRQLTNVLLPFMFVLNMKTNKQIDNWHIKTCKYN